MRWRRDAPRSPATPLAVARGRPRVFLFSIVTERVSPVVASIDVGTARRPSLIISIAYPLRGRSRPGPRPGPYGRTAPHRTAALCAALMGCFSEWERPQPQHRGDVHCNRAYNILHCSLPPAATRPAGAGVTSALSTSTVAARWPAGPISIACAALRTVCLFRGPLALARLMEYSGTVVGTREADGWLG